MILASDELTCVSCRQTLVLYRPGRDKLMTVAFSVDLAERCVMIMPDAPTFYLNLRAESCIMPDMRPLAAAVSA